jgi:hypothetical protein
MNTELLEEKYNLNQTIFILDHVMKKYDTYEKNLLKEILKYSTLCSCGSNTSRNLYTIICYKCLNNYINKKKQEIGEKKFRNGKIILLFIILLFIITCIIILTWNNFS